MRARSCSSKTSNFIRCASIICCRSSAGRTLLIFQTGQSSASRRLFAPQWSEKENLAAFGAETRAQHGTGRNYIAYFVFSGRVDPTTGMLINISEIKERAGRIVDDRYDHKFLNADNPDFRERPPTVENIARQLYLDVAPSFADVDAKLVACHLIESAKRSATAYSTGACEGNYWFEF